MQDFIRIGGAITSAPLNEDFRRLLNAISIANVNLVFPEENASVNTITDMLNIVEPVNAQACYVVSSGELYRYAAKDGKWHKIMDIGQTFRQGFLNSGAVVLEDYIKYKDEKTLTIPSMLVYFKNQPGDDRYLKGMYLIEGQDLDISSLISGANAYSLLVDYRGDFSVVTGMPSTDDPNHVFLGTFLVDKDEDILEDFIYTLPDIAYTADRGYFLLNGGEAQGSNLVTADDNTAKVNRMPGYYYDEGINFPIGKTDNFPVDSDNGSNFDLKHYPAQTPVDKLYYMVPNNPLGNDIAVSTAGLIINKYWDGSGLADVPDNYFTIQQHLVTPNGQNIILYGTQLYNSITDAASNLNSTYGVNINFPYIEATRIVVGNIEDFNSADQFMCRFYTLGRLAQVGTVSPEFADNVFRLYSGDADDITPASLRFNLKGLQDEEYNGLYNLQIMPYSTVRDFFYNDKKYITDDLIKNITKSADSIRNIYNNDGYEIADNQDLLDLKTRINEIEKEIWNEYQDNMFRYEQSLRYRLFHAEARLDNHDERIADHETRITSNEENKVNKGTSINGYTLGDGNVKNEAKIIALQTGDIAEGIGQGSATNLWYTEARVDANTNVAANIAHRNTISAADNATTHTKVNPHNLSTDDISILTDTTKIFVTPEEERRIRADRLPEDTIKALADLDSKNLDSVGIDYMEGNSLTPGAGPYHLGDIKNIRFFQDGVNLSMDSDGETLIVECLGQVDDTTVMFKSRYATLEQEYPSLYGGYVDRAVNAEFAHHVHGIEEALANQYYGTNADNVVGIYDLPKYVTTADAESFASIDQVTFVPIDGSVQEKHLETTLKDKINNNYHAIYNGGVLKSAEVNTFNFGNNLEVTISGTTAVINATGTGSGTGISNFANLADVDVVYTDNAGKMLVINNDETGIVLSDSPSLTEYMLKSIYVDTVDVSKVKKAVQADKATLADTATNALKVNEKIVDNTKNTNAVLWTADKIISNTSSQIDNEGVNTYSGASAPSDTLGKDGDLYVLIEN